LSTLSAVTSENRRAMKDQEEYGRWRFYSQERPLAGSSFTQEREFHASLSIYRFV
jgi:hypothetical protein